jgi:hypothetical protein
VGDFLLGAEILPGLAEADRLAGKPAVAETFSSTSTEKILVSREDRLLEETLAETGDELAAVEKRANVEPEEALSIQVARYLSRERREKLDEQIETLYGRVASELSDNPKDVAFALKKLQHAQDIVLEDMWRYEEALYWVAQIKKMLVTKHNLTRSGYSWGLFVFFYGLVWLILLIAGFFVDVAALVPGGRSFWFSALTGGIGGVVAILYNLSWHVSVKNDFDRQYVIKYLAQPLMGFILGGVIFLITNAVFVLFAFKPADAQLALLGGADLFQMLLGFVAGLHQPFIYNLIDRIVQSLSPTAKT